MNDWQSTCLGRRSLPRELSAFEIQAFFNFSDAERRVIEERRSPKLALALQIGFLRMTGRLLEALRIVPPALWRHLGEQFGVTAPDLASLRTMIVKAIRQYEVALARSIVDAVDPLLRSRWQATLTQPHGSGAMMQKLAVGGTGQAFLPAD